MPEKGPMHGIHAHARMLDAALERLRGLSPAGVVSHRSGGTVERFTFKGPRAAHDTLTIGVFACIHGDEPAGGLAAAELLTDLAARPSLAAGYEIHAYPAVNLPGLLAGTREKCPGVDLNRLFWQGSSEPEVVALEAELRTIKFNGLLSLHSDDTAEGIYGYAHGKLLNESLLRPALLAAERVLPRDPRRSIDGFAADGAVLADCFPGVLSAPPELRPAPFDIIFETPGGSDLALQASSMKEAMLSILSEYRQFIAYGDGL